MLFADERCTSCGTCETQCPQGAVRLIGKARRPYWTYNCQNCQNDTLYFINNDADGHVRARAKVKSVLNSEKLTKEASAELVDRHQDKLQLTGKQYKRWAGKRYLVLIEVSDVESIEPFGIDRSDYGNMDDWLPVEQIEKARLEGDPT